jgi:hypothetical protein
MQSARLIEDRIKMESRKCRHALAARDRMDRRHGPFCHPVRCAFSGVSATPGTFRRIGVVFGGSFEGERLSGEVLDGGNDWQTVRDDGATTLNVRLALKTKDGALISMAYQGFRHGPPDVVDRIEKGRLVTRSCQWRYRLLP